jgi:uncharacterized protein
MDPTLASLIRFQEAENELRQVDTGLAAAPKTKAALDARLAEERGRLDAARGDLEAAQKSRKQHESSVQDLEVKRSKYKAQLMEVKTNKEYTAMLHEIETVEREIRSREDQILVEMEKAEALASEVKKEESAFRTIEEDVKAEERRLEAQVAKLAAERKRLTAERDGRAAEVPEDALVLYQRVAKLRGIAVGPAVDGMCTLCRVKLRLQMWVDLKKNDQVTQCPACSRVLYYEAPVPVVVPQP